MTFSLRHRIAVILPRNMHFGPAAATSIDLCAYDSVRYSALADGIVVVGEAVAAPFPDVTFWELERGEAAQRYWNRRLLALLEEIRPALIEVHQHLPTAAAVARRFPDAPVVLVRHNFIRARRNPLKRWHVLAQCRRLARIAFVSDATRAEFERDFTPVAERAMTVPNGIDTQRWRPADGPRERVILYAGRIVPDKGVLELAQALARLLPRHPGWRAEFIGAGEATYEQAVKECLAPVADRAAMLGALPFPQVMERFARAEIAVVPSVWRESFGRTAIEAMAGGAALLTSGRGGLREVAADAAMYAEPTPDGLQHGLETLLADAALRRRLAAAGRERVVNAYDIRRTVGRMDALRQHFLGGRQAMEPLHAGA